MADETNPFSPAQMKLITIVFKHLTSTPNADWSAVAADYGYKSGELAKTKFLAAQRLCKRSNTTVTGAAPVTTTIGVSAGGTPKKRGRPAKVKGDIDDKPKPAKKQRTKAAKKEEAIEEDEAFLDDSDVTIKEEGNGKVKDEPADEPGFDHVEAD